MLAGERWRHVCRVRFTVLLRYLVRERPVLHAYYRTLRGDLNFAARLGYANRQGLSQVTGIKPARLIALVCLALQLSACEGGTAPSGTDLSSVSERIRGCSTERDDWRPSPQSLVEPVNSDPGFAPSSGIVLLAERIVAFDGHIPAIAVLTRANGVPEAKFGRQGDGPGEFQVVRSGGIFPRLATHDWVTTLGDSILAFDGRRLQLFSGSGEPVREWFPLHALENAGAFSLSLRIREHKGDLLMDIERLRKGENERKFAILRIEPSGSVDTVFRTLLPAIPTTESGGWYQGPREATPLWDTWANCFVVTDGSSAVLLIGALDDGRVDSVRIEVPLRSPRIVGEEEISRLSGGRKRPEPARLRHIRRIIVSPDGWIWLEPVQPDGLSGVEVFRVNLRLREQRVDTVPLFPSAFGSHGEYYSVARGADGGYGLRRVLMLAPSPSSP